MTHAMIIGGIAADLSAVVVLAALIRFNVLMRAAGRRIVGRTETWGDHTYEIRHHLLYARIWTKRGFHSSAMFD